MFAKNNENNHVRPILYYDDINPHSRAVLMILNMLNADIELRAVEMIKGEHLKPAYAKINPARTVPTMVHDDLVVTGNAIFSYVCENNDNEKAKQLIAFKCYKRHCRVLSRLYFESQVLHRIHGQLMTDLVRKTLADTDVDYHQKKVEYAYDVMETYLKDGPFMTGSVLTAVDISFVACLGALDMMFPIDADRTRWEKLNDWFRRMRSLSVQKINTNGTEKQRQIVEYYAKFRFASAVKRTTAGVRQSAIPRFTLSHARCSIGVQTTKANETEDNDEPYSVELEGQLIEQTPNVELTQRISSTDVINESLDSNTNKTEPKRSSGGAQKEKPPVPPKRKTNTAIVMTTLTENSQCSVNMQINELNAQKPTALEKSVNVAKDKCPISSAENQNNKHVCGCDAKSLKKCLSRLNGGVEPPVPPKMMSKDEFPIQPVRDFLSNSVNNSTDTSKGANKTLPRIPLAAKPVTTIISPKTSTEKLKKIRQSKIPLLPPGLPINSPQTTLQYLRRSHMPNEALAAPPPTPDNSSPDEQSDFEFPPPPPEAIINNLSSSGKALKLAEFMTKTESKSTTKSLAKNTSGVKSTTESLSATRECTSRIIGKKSSDFKSISCKKNAPIEQKVWKPIKNTKNVLLLANGTKSPFSNVSQASLQKNLVKKVQKISNEVKIVQKVSAAKTAEKTQEKEIQKLEKIYGVKAVASSASSVNAIKKASGRSLISSGTTELISKACEKKRRILGGGQGPSKVKVLPVVAATQANLLGSVLKLHPGVEEKAAILGATKCNTTAAASAKPKAEKTKPKIPTKSMKNDAKLANQRSSETNKLKVFPTKISGRNQTKTTINFNTSPYKADVGSSKNQPKAVVKKYPLAKIKRKKGTKAANVQVLKVSQIPQTHGTTVQEIKCDAAVESKTQQRTATDILTSEEVVSKPSAAASIHSCTVQTQIETTSISASTSTPRASNPEQASSSTAKDVPISVSLVAKTLQILSAAKSNLCPAVDNTVKVLPPQPPPLPPPPVPFQMELPPPLPPPPNLSQNDALPQAGTVAKALQSLGAVALEANPICGTHITFRKVELKKSNVEESKSLVVNNAAPLPNLTRIVEETVDARPLAEILTATVHNMNKIKVENTSDIGLTYEKTQQALTNSKKLSDKTLGNMAQVAVDDTTATKIKQLTDTVELDRQITSSLALKELNNSAEERLVYLNEFKESKISTEETVCETHAEPPRATELNEALVPPIKLDLIEAEMPAQEASHSLILKTHEMEKSYPSLAACTDNPNISETADKSPQAAKTAITGANVNRNIIQRALLSEDIVGLESTPLPAQPNIIITGYTHTKPNTVDPLFSGTGRLLGNTIAHTLRAQSVGPCSLGPSANVVISTFGYTPISALDSTPEQLLPIKPKYAALPPSIPLQLNAKPSPTTTDNKAAQECHAEVVLPVRAISPRTREDRPYPTAHRSRGQRASERKIINRGRVM